jgi:hypothetical protein
MTVSVRPAESPTTRAQDSLNGVMLLMPVWGYRFATRFLEFCLPTLLAPNNLPALARELPCRFVVLSSSDDEPLIRAHPTWQKLADVCTTEIQLIDDLITHANHSATITLAFERALRQAGPAMRHTCFFFLMSDYLVADGSLKTVLKTIRSGARGVLVGNFQINVEDAAPLLRSRFDTAATAMALHPRELVRWSLGCLHAATLANIVNIGLIHNDHTNRLFWRVDESTLLGRFYLMHPIALHPEVDDFVIGSSWDYSFIPELCPSGNVATITDSDDYLVVELQRRDYENDNLRPGPIEATELAESLMKWATARHRANVEQTVVFHAEERPPGLAEAVVQSDAFVNYVRAAITIPPISHRDHPFWVGALAVNRFRSNRPLGRDDWKFILSDQAPPNRICAAVRRVRAKLVGHLPAPKRSHPLWSEYELAREILNRLISQNGRFLLVAENSAAYSRWVAEIASNAFTIDFDKLLQMPRAIYASLMDTFDGCFFLVSESRADTCDTLIDHVTPLLKPAGAIHLLFYNDRALRGAVHFVTSFTKMAAKLLRPAVSVKEVHYVKSNFLHWSVRRAAMQVLRRIGPNSSGSVPPAVLAAGPALLATYLANLTVKITKAPPAGICSGVLVTLQVSQAIGRAIPRLPRPSLGGSGLGPDLTGEERIGARPLDLAMSELGQFEPSQLTTGLLAYRFVARLLAGRHDVAEYGLANALGTRLILQSVKQVRLFDPRPLIAEELQRQLGDKVQFEAHQHDILASPLKRPFDAIYSIDFIKYISRDEEDKFVRNLMGSLGRNCYFLLIGSPSFGRNGQSVLQTLSKGPATPPVVAVLEQRLTVPRSPLPPSSAPRFASPGNVALAGEKVVDGGAKIYRRTGVELTTLMQQYFHNALSFSLVDDVVQAGFHSNAQHIFALCCGKRE